MRIAHRNHTIFKEWLKPAPAHWTNLYPLLTKTSFVVGQDKPHRYHWPLNMYLTQNIVSVKSEVLLYTRSGTVDNMRIFPSNNDVQLVLLFTLFAWKVICTESIQVTVQFKYIVVDSRPTLELVNMCKKRNL